MGKVAQLADLVRRNVELLDGLAQAGAERVVSDPILLNAALHMIQTSIQALLDVSCHLLAEAGRKPPDSYAELAGALAEAGFLSSEEASLMRRIAGFRNVIVHMYLRLNLELLKEILEGRRYRDLLALASKLLLKAAELGVDP